MERAFTLTTDTPHTGALITSFDRDGYYHKSSSSRKVLIANYIVGTHIARTLIYNTSTVLTLEIDSDWEEVLAFWRPEDFKSGGATLEKDLSNVTEGIKRLMEKYKRKD